MRRSINNPAPASPKERVEAVGPGDLLTDHRIRLHRGSAYLRLCARVYPHIRRAQRSVPRVRKLALVVTAGRQPDLRDFPARKAAILNESRRSGRNEDQHELPLRGILLV